MTSANSRLSNLLKNYYSSPSTPDRSSVGSIEPELKEDEIGESGAVRLTRLRRRTAHLRAVVGTVREEAYHLTVDVLGSRVDMTELWAGQAGDGRASRLSRSIESLRVSDAIIQTTDQVLNLESAVSTLLAENALDNIRLAERKIKATLSEKGFLTLNESISFKKLLNQLEESLGDSMTVSWTALERKVIQANMQYLNMKFTEISDKQIIDVVSAVCELSVSRHEELLEIISQGIIKRGIAKLWPVVHTENNFKKRCEEFIDWVDFTIPDNVDDFTEIVDICRLTGGIVDVRGLLSTAGVEKFIACCGLPDKIEEFSQGIEILEVCRLEEAALTELITSISIVFTRELVFFKPFEIFETALQNLLDKSAISDISQLVKPVEQAMILSAADGLSNLNNFIQTHPSMFSLEKTIEAVNDFIDGVSESIRAVKGNTKIEIAALSLMRTLSFNVHKQLKSLAYSISNHGQMAFEDDENESKERYSEMESKVLQSLYEELRAIEEPFQLVGSLIVWRDTYKKIVGSSNQMLFSQLAFKLIERLFNSTKKVVDFGHSKDDFMSFLLPTEKIKLVKFIK